MKPGWEVRRLGEVATIVMGQAPPSSECNKDGRGTPFVKAGEFTADRPLVREWTTRPLKLAKATDVLVCVVGATCGKISLGADCAIGRSVAAVRPRHGAITQEWLFHFLSGKVALLRAGSLGAAQTVITQEMIADQKLMLPPLAEQRRIVEVLDEAFAGLATATANAEQILAGAREFRLKSIQQATMPSSLDWDSHLFPACVRTLSPPTKIQRSGYLPEGALPIISQEAEFINGYWNDPHDAIRLTRPVVVFGDHTQVIKYVDFDFVQGADGLKILEPGAGLNARFLAYVMEANPITALGYARHFRLLKQTKICFPSENAQRTIVALLDEISEAIGDVVTAQRAKLTLLAELKASLLHRAFAGELV